MRKTSKLILVAGAVAALAAPSAAMAAPLATGVSTNGNTKDAVGYAVSAGQYNVTRLGNGYGGTYSTGAARAAYNADSEPGAVADFMHWVKDADLAQTPYAPPAQP